VESHRCCTLLCAVRLRYRYYKYKVIFAVNVLRPWEAIIFNTFFFMLGALILYATFFRVLAVIRWLMNASAFVKSLTTPVNKCTSGVCSNPRVIT